ncbi:MAG: hypothetical protein NTU61_03265 [Candidatus Altiarchaeota archaeon]|nr:hypothetical protein [Candidatus Altiarchaeota archaeon]
MARLKQGTKIAIILLLIASLSNTTLGWQQCPPGRSWEESVGKCVDYVCMYDNVNCKKNVELTKECVKPPDDPLCPSMHYCVRPNIPCPGEVSTTSTSTTTTTTLPKEWALKGRITDGHGNPLPYMTVTADMPLSSQYNETNENGSYVIQLGKFHYNKTNPVKITLTAEFSYFRNEKNYFTVNHGISLGGGLMGVSTPESFKKEFKLREEQDLAQNIDLKINAPAGVKTLTVNDTKIESTVKLSEVENIAAIYRHMHEAVDFSIKNLKANIDYNLPVKAVIGDRRIDPSGQKTYYSSNDASVAIGLSDSAYGSTNKPKNREYHEFAHHLMYASYGGWPDGFTLAGSRNHAGYINPSTGDSFVEGFAEFMTLAISDYRGDRDPEHYASFGSMENNYRSWDSTGAAEEFAVCGVLWDLYDKNNDQGDTVTLNLSQMWPILKVKRKNFYEYYTAFRTAFPGKADAIDKIFIEHGFFADTGEGNHARDAFEPYRDSPPPANNSMYEVGEFFVDYGVPDNRTQMAYNAGEKIGKASNYERPLRETAGYIPKAFIKVPDTEVHYYKVSVHYNNPADGKDYEYDTEVRQGLLYLMPLPDDVDATLTVKPDSQDYTAQQTYSITTKEYRQKYYSTPDNQNYFDTHTFNLKPTGTHKDQPYNTPENTTLQWNTDLGPDTKTQGQTPTTCCFPAISILITALAAAIIKS